MCGGSWRSRQTLERVFHAVCRSRNPVRGSLFFCISGRACLRTEWRRPRPPWLRLCSELSSTHDRSIRLKSRTGGVLSLDGCEQKAASEMVAKTGAKGKFNNGCPSFLQMLADSYGRISPFSDHDRCLSSPGFFLVGGYAAMSSTKRHSQCSSPGMEKQSPRLCPSSVKSVVTCPFFSLFQQVCPLLGCECVVVGK